MKNYEDNYELCVVDGETLSDMRLPPTRYCVEGLLPEGPVHSRRRSKDRKVVAGAGPLCPGGQRTSGLGLSLAAGRRPLSLPGGFALPGTGAAEQDHGLAACQSVFCGFRRNACGRPRGAIRGFRLTHPALTLVVVDTFQVVRGFDTEVLASAFSSKDLLQQVLFLLYSPAAREIAAQ